MKNNREEKTLEKRIILNLKLFGYYIYKTASHGGCFDYNIGMNQAGIADLIVIGGENIITFLEVKSKNGRQSIAQKAFEEICVKNKIKYAVVRSVREALSAVGVSKNNACK